MARTLPRHIGSVYQTTNLESNVRNDNRSFPLSTRGKLQKECGLGCATYQTYNLMSCSVSLIWSSGWRKAVGRGVDPATAVIPTGLRAVGAASPWSPKRRATDIDSVHRQVAVRRIVHAFTLSVGQSKGSAGEAGGNNLQLDRAWLAPKRFAFLCLFSSCRTQHCTTFLRAQEVPATPASTMLVKPSMSSTAKR